MKKAAVYAVCAVLALAVFLVCGYSAEMLSRTAPAFSDNNPVTVVIDAGHGGEDGGVFYRHIAAAYGEKLKKGGWLVLEIGCGQQTQLREILAACSWAARVECRKDYGGNDRVILAQRGL